MTWESRLGVPLAMPGNILLGRGVYWQRIVEGRTSAIATDSRRVAVGPDSRRVAVSADDGRRGTA